MSKYLFRFSIVAILLLTSWVSTWAEDWTAFRGPTGMGVSSEKNLPLTWSATENIAWQVKLPGPGSSSPITLGDRLFVTCYSGYGLEPNEGEQENLRRHVLCFDSKAGKLLWEKVIEPELPEHKYEGEGAYQGYAGSTPTTDGQRLYIFFGKSGVFCFDLDGKELWHTNVGDGINRWGSGCSPILYSELLIVNASVESRSLVALNKLTGEKVWETKGIDAAWNTPLVVPTKERKELIVSVKDRILSVSPDTGIEFWHAEGVHRYVCPSVVAQDEVVFAIGGGHTSLAVRCGGADDVTDSHGLWRLTKGSNVGSPLYHEGHLYWASDNGGIICCQNAATGEVVFQERLDPGPGRIWSSPVLVEGKLYFVSQHKGVFVVAAEPTYKLLAHNVIEGDDSRSNGSLAASNGAFYMRSDRNLYCIKAK